jgi:membrane protease YdiL (CAAX protease family)
MVTNKVRSEVRAIPAWQIALVLVGFPALYMANSFTPWSRELFVEGTTYGWWAFWGSTFVLHWTSVAIALGVMRRHGWTLRDVGIHIDRRRRVWLLVGAVAIGLVAVAIREVAGELAGVSTLVNAWSASGAPHTTTQRLFWVVMGIVTAAFCEEFTFRGFGFHALRSRGKTIVVAGVLASLGWIAVHGLAGVFGFPGYAVLAFVLTGLLVRDKSLVSPMILHSAIHVFVILGS